jgi:hypothetical protein
MVGYRCWLPLPGEAEGRVRQGLIQTGPKEMRRCVGVKVITARRHAQNPERVPLFNTLANTLEGGDALSSQQNDCKRSRVIGMAFKRSSRLVLYGCFITTRNCLKIQ